MLRGKCFVERRCQLSTLCSAGKHGVIAMAQCSEVFSGHVSRQDGLNHHVWEMEADNLQNVETSFILVQLGNLVQTNNLRGVLSYYRIEEECDLLHRECVKNSRCCLISHLTVTALN